MQREHKERITKKEWYALGGFANSDLFRKQTRGGSWRYYRSLDNQAVCKHDYGRLPGYSLGCVTYQCTKCGDEYEKDVS